MASAQKAPPSEQQLLELFELVNEVTSRLTAVAVEQENQISRLEHAANAYGERYRAAATRAGVSSYEHLLKRPPARSDMVISKVLQYQLGAPEVRVRAPDSTPTNMRTLPKPTRPAMVKRRLLNSQLKWGTHPLDEKKFQLIDRQPEDAVLQNPAHLFTHGKPPASTNKQPSSSSKIDSSDVALSKSLSASKDVKRPIRPGPPRRSSLEDSDIAVAANDAANAPPTRHSSTEGRNPPPPPRRSSLEEQGLSVGVNSAPQSRKPPPPPRRGSAEVLSEEPSSRKSPLEGAEEVSERRSSIERKPPPPPRRQSSSESDKTGEAPLDLMHERPKIRPPVPPPKRASAGSVSSTTDDKSTSAGDMGSTPVDTPKRDMNLQNNKESTFASNKMASTFHGGRSVSNTDETGEVRPKSAGGLAARQAMLAGMLGGAGPKTHPSSAFTSEMQPGTSSRQSGALPPKEDLKTPKSLASDTKLASAKSELEKKLLGAAGGNAVKNADLSKYEKMIKAGLPQGAIEHAMRKDGMDPSLLFH